MSDIERFPGLVDLHVHLREPSDNDSETIANGSYAAMIGGYTLVCDMPNNPGHPTWTVDRLDEKIAIAKRDAVIPVRFNAGAQPESKNLDQLAGMAEKAASLKLYGAPTTGNDLDYTARDFRDIVRVWHEVAPEKPILLHAGKDNLEGIIDLVADENQHPLHICHVNDIEEVDASTEAKQRGYDVTCGVCPHHVFKTSHDVKTQGWFARMVPALATQFVSEALWGKLADGEIDVIETDYAPHSVNSKMAAEEENPTGIHDPHHRTCFGVPGIEHVAPMLFRQAKLGSITMERLMEAMHSKPLEILRLPEQEDTYVEWNMKTHRIGEDSVRSGAGWSPYVGALGVGVVAKTVVNGRTVYEREAA